MALPIGRLVKCFVVSVTKQLKYIVWCCLGDWLCHNVVGHLVTDN